MIDHANTNKKAMLITQSKFLAKDITRDKNEFS